MNNSYMNNEQLKDAWLDGKLEAAYLVNRHLNNFKIDTKVNQSRAFLSGQVDSELDRQLAEQIAHRIDGIQSVQNNLAVVRDADADTNWQRQAAERRSFREWFEDATISTRIKSKLLFDKNTSGMSVNVDSDHGHVTLTGQVDSVIERNQAESLAREVDGVNQVVNQLTIARPS